MASEDSSKGMHRLGEVAPELRRFVPLAGDEDERPLTEQEIEEGWSKPSEPETPAERKWSLSWVGVVTAVTIAAVVYLAVRRGSAPSRIDPEPATFRSEAEVRAEAEATLKAFHEAGDNARRAQFVLEPERMSPLMAEYYSRDGAGPQSLKGIDVYKPVRVNGHPWSWIQYHDGDMAPHVAALKETREGYKLDWESLVAYGEMAWDEFCESRPTTPTQMRVYLAHASYHNYKYSDPERYAAFRIESRTPSRWLYGYVARGSPAHLQLADAIAPGALQPANVRLRFEPDAGADNLVVIDELIHTRWGRPSLLQPPPE